MTNNYKFTYKEFLDLTNKKSPRQRCLNSLMTEVYKCLNGIWPDIMNNVVTVSKHGYNVQHYNLFVTDRPKTDSYGWSLLPGEIKHSASWDFCKSKFSNGFS